MRDGGHFRGADRLARYSNGTQERDDTEFFMAFEFVTMPKFEFVTTPRGENRFL